MRLALHWQIAIALGLAVVAGLLTPVDGVGVSLLGAYDFIGTLFLNALKMIIVPLVMASIINGIAGVGVGEHVGRLGLKTLGFYVLSSLSAVLVGLLLVNLLTPGLVDGAPAGDRLALTLDASETDALVDKVEGRSAADLAAVFIRMVPPNIVAAAGEGQMLGLIVFSLLFGFFMMRVTPDSRDVMRRFWRGVFETMMAITLFIMRFAPLGVFGLVAEVVATTGFAAFRPMLLFFVTVVLALAAHVLIVMPLFLRLLGRVSPRRHARAMAPALLTAFSTASSSATLPLTIECVEKNAGVSNRTSSLVLPLGATVNMDGTALYECVAALFLAQAYGLELTWVTQLTVVLVALLTSIGVAGIPAASLVAIAVILGAIGLPLEAIGLLLVTDRILDMLRTAVNVFGDTVCAVVVARSEGEPVLTGD